jgi:hypothetical protein
LSGAFDFVASLAFFRGAKDDHRGASNWNSLTSKRHAVRVGKKRISAF